MEKRETPKHRIIFSSRRIFSSHRSVNIIRIVRIADGSTVSQTMLTPDEYNLAGASCLEGDENEVDRLLDLQFPNLVNGGVG